ncbi:nuclease-like protein [Bacillus oleivorans]|uniref:Nuclease-like protein n=1 Tax=Bacillus oleivorans TaxID=1448271 RepID=A0A285CJY4_9BACI|nr:NERD domain-containing protein [Bacillus oleivorans]SNX67316.1 nuclease-like protein [Bacillus oleivorans]
MNLLSRSIPTQILIIEALFRRLNPNHRIHKDLREEYNRRKKGVAGEKQIDYYLEFLPPEQFYIFRGLRLICDNKAFQIDTLVISQKFVLLIEAKDISGKLYFDESYKQLVCINEDGDQQVMEDPLEQVKRQSRQFVKWMGLKLDVPIEYLVVLGDSRTYIDPRSGPKYKDYILHAHALEEKIQELACKNQKDIFQEETLRKLTSRILTCHNPLSIDPQKTYQYSSADIIKGIQCPECKKFGMERANQVWECPHCKATSRDAHKQAILDYLLLIKPTITNKECRDFLGIKSRKIAHRLLNSMNLQFTGTNKSRIYYKPKHG